MKATYSILFIVFLWSADNVSSQTQTVKENTKWGIKENDSFIIPAVYDTIFNFDSTNKVCLACFKFKKASSSQFIKTMSTSYSCNYLDKKAQRLITRSEQGDTLSVFSLGKNTVSNYQSNQTIFVVSSKGKKNLVDKNFKQLTFKGYQDINLSNDKNFYFGQIINEADVVVDGLVNTKEREIIPFNYSIIKINTSDSLIIACSAGIRMNSEDFVFDYEGRKKEGSYRHIDMATKHFLIHKIFEPKEYYIFYNLETKQETNLTADELKVYRHDEILVRIKKDWYLYDLNTNIKTPFKKS